MSCKLGERAWPRPRAEARKRGGNAFSLKDFHSGRLGLGSMGLGPLRETLARV